MKTHLIPRYLFFLLLFPALGVAETSPQLLLVLNNTQVELGRFIHATLYGIDLPRDILASDLNDLETNFGINIAEDGLVYIKDSRWPNQKVQTLQFGLYPRQAGKIRVARLNIDGYRSKAQILDIKPGKVKGNSIAVTTSISSKVPWERQQVIFTVDITTPELFASLSAEELNKTPGLEILTLPASKQRTTTANGDTYASLKLAWAIFPLLPGKHIIALPTIKYQLSGRVQRTYYLPKIQLNARALPPYIPPTMPVAHIDIHSSVNVSSPLNTNSLSYWEIILTSSALLPYWLPPILNQIQPTEALSYLQIETKRTLLPNSDGVNGQVRYHIPFKARHSGIITLPEIRLQSFDPTSGRLITMTQPSQKFLVLSTVLRWFLMGSFTLFFFWLSNHLWQRWILAREHKKKRNLAFAKLEHCQDIPTLRSAITLISDAQGLPPNLPLSQWANSCGYRIDSQFEPLVARISRYCYSREKNDDLNTLRTELLTIIKRSR